MENRLTKRQYNTIHQWVKRHYLKTGKCQHCYASIATQWANVSGQYLRDNRDDWIELCAKCHYQFDIAIHQASLERRRSHRPTITLKEVRQEFKRSHILFDRLENVQARIASYSWYG